MLNRYLRIEKIFLWMLLFIPLSALAAFLIDNPVIQFTTAILAIIPIARIVGFATNEIALQTNPTISGLVSATFGNIIELIVAVFALQRGLVRVVQASVVGSILGNILLLIGMSVFVGGLRHKYQRFNNKAANVSSTMLIIAVVGVTIPSVYAFTNPASTHIPLLSDAVALVLAAVYIGGLFFSLCTHRDLFDASDEIRATRPKSLLSKKAAYTILLLATLVATVESDILVDAIQGTALDLGMTQTFIGVVLIAIITNIAEKASAVQFAIQNKLDISLEIGMSSAIQIALFVAPLLVLASQLFGFGFTLVFSMFEVVSILLAVMIINHLAADGVCNWLEGIQLMSVYTIIAIVFYFV
ncbi:calcium/proton exchanger [Candidatus Woesearchaeota archaeon]|nr:calcium/proton exchanger [Candidatus Woesearchaeota archaeon]